MHHFLFSRVCCTAHLKIYTYYLPVGKMSGKQRVKETNTSQLFAKSSLWRDPTRYLSQKYNLILIRSRLKLLMCFNLI